MNKELEEYLTTLPRYVEGMVLGDDEYILKVRSYNSTGFLSKLTKKGIPPKPFTDWDNRPNSPNTEVYIFKEEFSSGWYYSGFRGGESKDWSIVKHPKGFLLEINYWGDGGFDQIIKTHDILKSKIIGTFKWQENKLIEKV